MDCPSFPATDLLPVKRKRLSFACNYCRSKKTRCDEQHPRCRACQVAGVECITTDKRRPEARVLSRRRAPECRIHQHPELPSSPASPSNTKTTSDIRDYDQSIPQVEIDAPPTLASSTSPMVSNHATDTDHLPMLPSPLAETTTVQQMTQWSEIAFARLRRPKPFESYAAKNRSMELDMPLRSFLSCPRPKLPSIEEIRIYTDRFFDHLYPIYPFVSRSSIEPLFAKCCTSQLSVESLLGQDVPAVALTYLVSIFGLITAQISTESQAIIQSYLHYCNTLTGHLIANRSTRSIQAILLFSMVLRTRDLLTWSWDVLTIAISMAQSLRLNETAYFNQGHGEGAPLDDESEAERTWWCLYAFEKVLAFEVGRQSMIRDPILSAIRPWADPKVKRTVLAQVLNPQNRKLAGYKYALISLANLLYEMQQRAFHSWGREEIATADLDGAVAKIVRTAGEIAAMLIDWQHNLPIEYHYV